MIRATLNVGLVCQTISSKPIEVGKESEVIRDDVACKMIYAANGMYLHDNYALWFDVSLSFYIHHKPCNYPLI